MQVLTVPEQANVSNIDKLSDLTPFKGYKGFQLSSGEVGMPISRLDGSYNFFPAEGYRGLLTRAVSSADGTFTTPPEVHIHLRGQKTPNFLIVFDRLCNEYATELEVEIIMPEGDSPPLKLTSNCAQLFVDLYSFFPTSSFIERAVIIRIKKWS